MFNSEYTDRLFSLGYEPFPISGKIPFPGFLWKDAQITQENIDFWKIQYDNAGIAIRNRPAIDMDIYNKYVADAMREWFIKRFGADFAVLVRVGQPPKFLIPIRGDFDKKMISDAFGTKEEGISRIEVLSTQQYWVSHGIHPDTKAPYEWTHGSIVNTPIDQLPELTEDDIHEVFQVFKETCELYGVPLFRKTAPERDMAYADALNQMDRSANSAVDKFMNEADLAALLIEKGFTPTGTVGNTPFGPSTHYTRPGKDHGPSVGLLEAVEGAYPPGLYVWSTEAGFPITDKFYNAFAVLGYLFHQESGADGPDWTAACRDVRSRGFQDEIEEGDFIGLTPDSLDEVLVERLYWVQTSGEVVDTARPKGDNVYPYHIYKNSAANFEGRHERPFFPGTETRDNRTPVVRWLESPRRQDVDIVEWKPSAESTFVSASGSLAYNCFQRPDWAPTKREDHLPIILNHLRFITGGVQDQYEYFLSWLAHLVSRPEQRPTVTMLLIAVAHGTGRGFVDQLMYYTLGSWNCGNTTVDQLAGVGTNGQWQDYLYRKLYVTIPEARGEKKNLYEIDDSIRDKLTTTNMYLNLKYGKNRQANIYARIIMSSNSKIPLILSEEDRRMVVFECREKPKGQNYYDALYSHIENPETIRQFVWFLRRWHEAHPWSPYGPVPLTDEKRRLIRSSVDPVGDAINVLLMRDGLPDLITFPRLKLELDAIQAEQAGDDDTFTVTGINPKHLATALQHRFEQAYQGKKIRLPGGGNPVALWIIKNESQWVTASLDECKQEMTKWDSIPTPNINYSRG